METRTQFHRTILVGAMLAVLAMLLLVSMSINLPRAQAQQPNATPKKPANGYRYFFPFIAKACEEYCVGWAVGGAADGYGVILRTDDSGVTWRRQGQVGQIPNVDLNGVSAVDAQNAWAVGGKAIFRTRDGGSTWESQALPAGLPADFELFKVKALDTQTAFVVGGSGVLLQTSDGTTWTKMPTSPDLPLIQYSDVDAVDATHVWAVGGVITDANGTFDPRGGLGIAFYNGTQWQPQLLTHTKDDCNVFIGVSAIDQDVAWAVGGPSCPPYKTVNGGTTWQAVGAARSAGHEPYSRRNPRSDLDFYRQCFFPIAQRWRRLGANSGGLWRLGILLRCLSSRPVCLGNRYCGQIVSLG